VLAYCKQLRDIEQRGKCKNVPSSDERYNKNSHLDRILLELERIFAFHFHWKFYSLGHFLNIIFLISMILSRTITNHTKPYQNIFNTTLYILNSVSKPRNLFVYLLSRFIFINLNYLICKHFLGKKQWRNAHKISGVTFKTEHQVFTVNTLKRYIFLIFLIVCQSEKKNY